MTEAMIGHSSIFELGRGNLANDFDEIAGLTAIGPPAFSRDAVDASNMKSPERGREFIGGMRNGGAGSFEFDFVPGSTSETHILNAIMDDDPRPIHITFPNGVKWKFNALLTNYKGAAPLEGKMTATCDFQVSGIPDFGDD